MGHLVMFQPVVTEKSLRLAQDGKYTFAVPRYANKLSIASAIESAYNVSVKAVNITKSAAKPKQRGHRSAIQKAVVTLKKGDTIKGFEMPIESDADDKDDKKETDSEKKDK